MKAEEFGKYLRTLRKSRNLTIRQLELYSEVSHSYLSQVENGKRGIPSPEILKKLHGPLGVSYGDIMTRAGYLESSEKAQVNLDEEYHIIERFARNVSNKDRKKAINILEAAFEKAFEEASKDSQDEEDDY